ncbi:hypothetical protein [uncultured Tenacibaculum sp.]|uniref:hypothetical protein n=1 Tax=uncultured Tenacibaculum sp. TaxID=174713 RepID=UPI002619AB34|nr:hypothetical protein [uncultured Tenacibaculum sp.]
MKYLILSFLAITLASCSPKIEGNPERFKFGTFEIPAGDNYSKTIIVRKDSLQIEYYTKKVTVSTDSIVTEKEVAHIDTLYIKWRNNFSYTLKMKSPKTDLDKDPIFVQMNKVTDSSYNYISRIGYSKFKPEGTVYISKNPIKN